MATAIEYIASRAAMYSTDLRTPLFIEQASLETGTVFKSSLREKAIALLALHWLTIDDRGIANDGAVGTLKRIKEGSLEKEFMIDFGVTRQDPDLSQTKWGLELRQLRKSCIFAPMTKMSTPQ
jgi:hypothetical protein